MSYYSRSRSYGWGGFAPYQTTCELEARANRTIERLQKKQKRTFSPVRLEGRTIARTFWGKAWCNNIESYRDYAYRLERGRRYVRSGSVIDLQIEKGHVSALVVGSMSTPYEISITIKPMAATKWDDLVRRSTGKISSLISLTSGKLPEEMLKDFCNPETGLFPKPSEIVLSCDCPDGANCCKHVAAVLYGVGARLDNDPSLFFTLRGIDPSSLVSEQMIEAITGGTSSELETDNLGDVFGIDIEEEQPKQEEKPKRTRRAAKPQKKATKKPPKNRTPAKVKKSSAK